MPKVRRLLDMFCAAGGCAVGYHRAGFTEIVGVDIKPQSRSGAGRLPLRAARREASRDAAETRRLREVEKGEPRTAAA